MGDPSCLPPQSRAELRAKLRTLRAENERFRELLDRTSLRAERLDALLRTLLDSLEDNQPDATGYTLGRAGPGPTGPFEARYLEIRRHSDGAAVIRIDDLNPFRLPSGLADFLVHLVSGDAASDGLAGWKSRTSLREWLQEQTGRAVDAHYVNQRVHVLRRHLRAAGIKRHLIHTHPRKGVRFALRDSSKGSPRIVGRASGDCR